MHRPSHKKNLDEKYIFIMKIFDFQNYKKFGPHLSLLGAQPHSQTPMSCRIDSAPSAGAPAGLTGWCHGPALEEHLYTGISGLW